MIMTPDMWLMKVEIEAMENALERDPGDYMLRFELDELRIKYNKLAHKERAQLKLVHGGSHTSNNSTENTPQSA